MYEWLIFLNPTTLSNPFFEMREIIEKNDTIYEHLIHQGSDAKKELAQMFPKIHDFFCRNILYRVHAFEAFVRTHLESEPQWSRTWEIHIPMTADGIQGILAIPQWRFCIDEIFRGTQELFCWWVDADDLQCPKPTIWMHSFALPALPDAFRRYPLIDAIDDKGRVRPDAEFQHWATEFGLGKLQTQASLNCLKNFTHEVHSRVPTIDNLPSFEAFEWGSQALKPFEDLICAIRAYSAGSPAPSEI